MPGLTTTITSKGQLTIPKTVREKLGLKTGVKVEVYPTPDGRFIGMPRRKSRILEFGGDLKHVDDGRPLKLIRGAAQVAAAAERAKRLDPNLK